MLRPQWLVLPVLLAWAGLGQAEVIVHVHVPGIVDVQVGRPGLVVVAQPAVPRPVEAVPPPAEELPPPRPATPVALARPLTLHEFAAAFQPVPGTFEVELIHPRSGKPVTVCFTLPEGPPPRMCVRRHELAFDCGRREVTIRFGLCSRVRVSCH